MDFIRPVGECGEVYRCCGEEFEIDISTEENLVHDGERLLPQCPKCGMLYTGKPSLLHSIVAFPLWLFLIGFHFTICSVLTIFVHPESKRHKYYEYYAPWGWGKRNQ